MRSFSTLLFAGTLAIATTSAALAQESRGQQQPFGFAQPQAQQRQSREQNYNDWKSSDEARTFYRSEYSGQIKN